MYKLAADQENAEAQYLLGCCYEAGRGVNKDFSKAFHWYDLAAKQGNLDAQCCLGYCYEHGQGTAKDPKQAVHWYELAAKSGHGKAQIRLASCYADGIGVTRNLDTAEEWYKKAVKNGCKEARKGLEHLKGLKDEQEKNNLKNFLLGTAYIICLGGGMFLIEAWGWLQGLLVMGVSFYLLIHGINHGLYGDIQEANQEFSWGGLLLELVKLFMVCIGTGGLFISKNFSEYAYSIVILLAGIWLVRSSIKKGRYNWFANFLR